MSWPGTKQKRPVQGRGGHLPGPGLDYVAAGAARGHRRNRRRPPSNELPELVEAEPDPGRLPQPHDLASDGANTLEEMAEAATGLGLKYLGIGGPFAIADRRQRPDARARPPAAGRDRRAQRKHSREFTSSRGSSATSWPTAASITTTSCWRHSITWWPACTAISSRRRRR